MGKQAANARYEFQKNAHPELDALHQAIDKVTMRGASEEDVVKVIKAAPATAQRLFYADFTVDTQNFMIERGALKAGSDDDLALLAQRQPPEFFESLEAAEFGDIALNRGLIKTLDVFFARTPGAHGTELRNIMPGLEVLKSINRLYPQMMDGAVGPKTELGQNYLRGLDYLLAREPSAEERASMVEEHLIQYSFLTDMLPEFEKRGARLEVAITKCAKSFLYSNDTTALHNLEAYQRLKNGDEIPNKEQGATNKIEIGYNELLKSGAGEDAAIDFIQSHRIDISNFWFVSWRTMEAGFSRALTDLIDRCNHPDKTELAEDCLNGIDDLFSPIDAIDAAQDQRALSFIDLLIARGVDMGDEGRDILYRLSVYKNRFDLLPALIQRGGDLKDAQDHAVYELEDYERNKNDCEYYGPGAETRAGCQKLIDYRAPTMTTKIVFNVESNLTTLRRGYVLERANAIEGVSDAHAVFPEVTEGARQDIYTANVAEPIAERVTQIQALPGVVDVRVAVPKALAL